MSMTPEQVAAEYDRLAGQWLDVSTYGFAQIERAVAFVKHRATALDVGCGTGRLMGLLSKHGFRTDGILSRREQVAQGWLGLHPVHVRTAETGEPAADP